MTNPLYSVGQDVAVCTRKLEVVIPQTKVVAYEFRFAGRVINPLTGAIQQVGDRHCYQVDDAARSSITGKKLWFREQCLRPINPDTEYLEDEITISNGEKTQ